MLSRNQVKEFLPTSSLRRIVTLHEEIKKYTNETASASDRSAVASPPPGTRQNPVAQRTLLSSTFTAPLQSSTRAANQLGRGLLSAGDRLRDMIIPDTLATILSNPLVGITGQMRRGGERPEDKAKVEKLRRELEDILAANCPLCESVIVGLDKPFVKEGDRDTSWDL
jgi:vacuolar protein sorting-associated protein 18